MLHVCFRVFMCVCMCSCVFACVHVCLHVFVCVKDYNLVSTECTFLYLCLSISSFPACLPVYLPVSTYMSVCLSMFSPLTLWHSRYPNPHPPALHHTLTVSLSISPSLPTISPPLSPPHTLSICVSLSPLTHTLSLPFSHSYSRILLLLFPSSPFFL